MDEQCIAVLLESQRERLNCEFKDLPSEFGENPYGTTQPIWADDDETLEFLRLYYNTTVIVNKSHNIMGIANYTVTFGSLGDQKLYLGVLERKLN